jgi:ATP-binding cassette subfamily B protein
MPSARRGRPPATPIPEPTWGDRVRALRYVPKLVKLVWNTHPPYTLIMTVLRIARAFVPVAALWIGKLIIDRVVALRTTHGSATPLWHLVAAEIAIVFGGDHRARGSALVESLLGDLF